MSVNIHTLDISQFPLFKDVEPEVARKFLACGFNFSYDSGSPIIVNQDMGDTFFLLLSGLAKIALSNDKNEAVNVTLFRAGDFFGELSILDNLPVRTANVIATSEVEVLAVQKAEFLKMMKAHPELALNMARVLGQRLRAMNDRMVSFALPDLHRVARTLVHLSRQGKAFSEDGPILLPHIPLKDWVLFCNTPQDQFMDIMEKLRVAGAVEWQNQRIAVKDLTLLSKLSLPEVNADS